MTTLKSAYEKGQSWITNRMEKFGDLKYDKLKPRILSRGALSYSNNDKNCNNNNVVNFEQVYTRSRMHSIDVGELEHNKNKLKGFYGEIYKNMKNFEFNFFL